MMQKIVVKIVSNLARCKNEPGILCAWFFCAKNKEIGVDDLDIELYIIIVSTQLV